jgi:RimJ/RimL family protein N-acetyltransferase
VAGGLRGRGHGRGRLAPGQCALGQGYATEAAREALRFGFEQVGLGEIVSFTVPQNIRSRRVMERIGLVRDPAGDFDHPRVDPVAYPHLVPHVLYRLSRAGWEARSRDGLFPE